jgi:hypothetical protein
MPDSDVTNALAFLRNLKVPVIDVNEIKCPADGHQTFITFLDFDRVSINKY